MKNYHLIKVKYFGATNTKPSKIRLTSSRFDHFIFIDFDHKFNTSNEIAENWLKHNGHKIEGQCDDGIICDEIDGCFKPLKPL